MNKKKVIFIILLATFCVFTPYQSLLAAEKNSQAHCSRVRLS